MKTIVIALRATAVTLVLTGLLYPLAMTGVAQALFSESANGSLVKDNTGKVRGLVADRPAVHQPGLLSRPPVGGRQRLRRRRVERLQPRPHVRQAARSRQGGRRPPAQGEPRRARRRSRPSW